MRDGDPSLDREVPMAMVGLVSTGVSYEVNLSGNLILNRFSFFKLYAALHEWETGERRHFDFSANAFVDVYAGHINSLQLILDGRPEFYHQMMGDIYTAARYVGLTSSHNAMLTRHA
jgi:hypothetical protein